MKIMNAGKLLHPAGTLFEKFTSDVYCVGEMESGEKVYLRQKPKKNIKNHITLYFLRFKIHALYIQYTLNIM